MYAKAMSRMKTECDKYATCGVFCQRLVSYGEARDSEHGVGGGHGS